MDTRKLLTCFGALAVCLGLPNVASAADTCSGQWARVGATVVTLVDDRSAPTSGRSSGPAVRARH